MHRKPSLTAVCGALCLLALLSGCVAIPRGAVKDPRDPLERLNRTTFKIDDVLAHDVALPIGHAYTAVTPKFVRRGIANVFENAHTPDVMINDLLQGKFAALGQQTTRLILNSTVGLGGLLDPASAVACPRMTMTSGERWEPGDCTRGPTWYCRCLVLPIFAMAWARSRIASQARRITSGRPRLSTPLRGSVC